MTAPACGCRRGHLCDAALAERQRIVAERLAYMDGRRRTAPDSRQIDACRENRADGDR